MAARAVERDHVERAKSLVQRVESRPAPGAHRAPPRVRPRASLRSETRAPRAACPRGGRSRPVRTARTPDRRVQAHARVRWRVRGSPRHRRTTRAKRGSAFGQEPLELVHVEIARSDAEDIARRLGRRACCRRRGACGASRRRSARCWRRMRGIVAPERIDEAIARHDAISLEEQQREHAALLETTEWDDARVVDHFAVVRGLGTRSTASSLDDARTADRTQAVLKRRPSIRSAEPATTEGTGNHSGRNR